MEKEKIRLEILVDPDEIERLVSIGTLPISEFNKRGLDGEWNILMKKMGWAVYDAYMNR